MFEKRVLPLDIIGVNSVFQQKVHGRDVEHVFYQSEDEITYDPGHGEIKLHYTDLWIKL